MPLKERIYKDMVEAMKNKDNFLIGEIEGI